MCSDRIVEKFDDAVVGWVEIEFKDIRKHTLFRMFEPDENRTPVKNKSGYTDFWAVSDPKEVEGTDLLQVEYVPF